MAMGQRCSCCLSAFVLANLCVGAAALVIHLRHEKLRLALVPVVNFSDLLVIASAAACYIFVSSRSEVRSSKLHLHGLVLLLMLLGQVAYNVPGCWARLHTIDYVRLLRVYMVPLLCYQTFWWSAKVLLVLLMRQKVIALGPSNGLCAQASLWSRALLVSTVLCGTASVSAMTTAWALFFHGITAEEVFKAVSFKVADMSLVANVALWLFSLTILTGMSGMMIAGIGMLQAAFRLTRRAMFRLAERAVDAEQLAEVRRKLTRHLLGIVLSLISTLLVYYTSHLVDMVDLLGEETAEDLFEALSVTLDVWGDTVATLFLSGIGLLLIHEDRDAGDVSSHIRGLLHSAVLTSRADTVFEGRVVSTVSRRCIASFPGKYLADWNALTWACEQGHMSSACVFLPTSDPKGRFGRHMPRVDFPNACWCHALYGGIKPWGCVWFEEWKENVQRAVDLGLELVVVFFPSQAGRGKAPWDDLISSNLWDGVGLGGSQMAEVAFLEKCGFAVTEEDLGTFRRRMRSFRS